MRFINPTYLIVKLQQEFFHSIEYFLLQLYSYWFNYSKYITYFRSDILPSGDLPLLYNRLFQR